MTDKETRSGEAAIVQKQADYALRESEIKYRTLIEMTGTGYLILDSQGRVLDANQEYVRLSGHTRLHDILGKNVIAWTAKGAKQRNAEAIAQCAKNGFIRNFVTEYVDGSGKITPVEINASVDGEGESLRIISLCRDISERKRAEEESQRERRFFDQLVETAPEGIAITDTQGRVMRVNAEFVRMFGYRVDEAVGQYIDDLVAPPARREEARALTASTAQGGEIHLETVRCKKDGTLVDVSLIGAFVLIAGKPEAGYAIYRDITERKRAEEALRENRRQLTDIIEFLPDATLAIDKEGRVIIWNKAIEKMTGIPAAEMVGKCDCAYAIPFYGEARPTLMDLVFADREEIAARYPNITRQGNTVMAEVFCNALHNNEGAWVFAKASPLHDQSGNIIGAIESIRDITESKRAEEALQESEENFRHSLDDSPLGVRIVTMEGETIYANQAILDFYGFSSLEELRTTPLEKRYTSESYIEFKKRYERRQQGDDSPSEYEVNVVRKNGEVRHLLVSRKGQLWNGKKQYQLLYRDITEPKQAEAQLRQSQKMEAIGTLAGGVAHDFNNLLTGILGNIALMRGSLPPADPLLENLNAAETAARQAADLTKGLLTFSRSAMVLPVPMKIADALDAALALLKQSLPATMEIVRDYEQTAWNVLVDQSQLTQILLNLAVNARDAMKGQGTLTIRARNEVVGEEYLQTHPFARTGEFVHLSVTDTGPGMSSEVMQHLFEPFYTTKPIGSGTGLGLSVVYGAVKQAGGWITAVSTEGVGRTAPQKYPSEAPLGLGEHPRGDWKNILGGIGQTCSGATFDIYLPRCLEEPMQSFTPSPLSVDVRGETVLVVEDEPVVRTVTQALLSRSGYTVLTAADGASALNVLQDHPVGIGLILLDMTMPGMTTSEIVRAIRALDPTVPILLNSGYTSNGAVKQMLKEDSVQGFLGKPYSLGELTDKVQELLHRG
jgi:two-component system, cell cycle sensor histidine kinase and response regulator CckA